MVWVAIALAGVIARVLLAWASTGSNDVETWREFAVSIAQHGVIDTYRLLSNFNHPPLMGYFVEAALWASKETRIPFAFILKGPAMLSDMGVMVLIWRIWRRRGSYVAATKASALFGWSLCSILVTAYHGNTDSFCAFLCLLSLYLATEKHSYFIAGLAFGAAVNVKLIPLVAVPAILLSFSSWRALVRYCQGAVLGTLPFLPVIINCCDAFTKNALAYNSNFDNWGIPFLVIQSRGNQVFGDVIGRFGDWYASQGRNLVMACAVGLPLWLRLKGRKNRYEAFALAMSVFLILAPGFGVQYMVYLAPVAFAINPKWGAVYSTIAGLFIGLIYLTFLDRTAPLHSTFTTAFPMPGPLVGMIAWLLLIRFVWNSVRLRGAQTTL